MTPEGHKSNACSSRDWNRRLLPPSPGLLPLPGVDQSSQLLISYLPLATSHEHKYFVGILSSRSLCARLFLSFTAPSNSSTFLSDHIGLHCESHTSPWQGARKHVECAYFPFDLKAFSRLLPFCPSCARVRVRVRRVSMRS